MDYPEPLPPGTADLIPIPPPRPPLPKPDTPRPPVSSKGIENAKKRLRAFSIQKKSTPLSPIVPKPVSTGSTTVLIGKLCSAKITPKVEDDQKKKPKPPKPGGNRKSLQDSYTDLQKRTLSEIEDMKRKMELVELGIPLGLICPTSTSEKAMPTKAMPPIKSFLDPKKVDEIIREAKKAKVEGREFKFDYNKLLPDYDNPFQRRRDEHMAHEKELRTDRRKSESEKRDRKSDKYESRRHSRHRKDEKEKYKERSRDRDKEDSRKGTEKSVEKEVVKDSTDLDLNDYLVCDSWSLDNDDKTNSSSPKLAAATGDKQINVVQQSPERKESGPKVIEKIDIKIVKDPSEILKESLTKKKDLIKDCIIDSPVNTPKIEKLKPVIDSFKFEIDPNDDVILDIFDEDSNLEKYSQIKQKKITLYDSPEKKFIPFDHDTSKDTSMDGINDDTFLESVINEIRQDEMCEETSEDKRLVEYDESPSKDDYDSPVPKAIKEVRRLSITPELDDRMKEQSKQKSDFSGAIKDRNRKGDLSDRSKEMNEFSDGVRSPESGYKTSDTNESFRSAENFRLSIEKELDDALKKHMTKSTVESLETWSFVLKICQPLLFRHDKNKCYRETRNAPKLWYTENPKRCSCVKDRSIVYEELEMCKMNLVDRVYGCDQIDDAPFVNARTWYPRSTYCLAENYTVQPVASEWEAEDIQLEARPKDTRSRRSMTPERNEEIFLDREYQRFMEAVWPEVAEAKAADSRSTTPVRQDSRRKGKEDTDREAEDKKAKKIKLSSENWSQESDIEDEEEKSKKLKMDKEKEKSRKRKRSTSTLSSSDSDASAKKKRRSLSKKALKKAKSKEAKRRRMGKKLLKKLKEKQKQKKKADREDSEEEEIYEVRKKELKRAKKRSEQKSKKKSAKRKRQESSSSSTESSSSSDSSSESDSESDRRSKKKKLENKKRKEKKRKQSSSELAHGEELFDVNILKNIKTERLTDDEKCAKILEFSPRMHHKPREIINVKELQNDFVGNNIHIKKEVEEEVKEVEIPESIDVSEKEVEPEPIEMEVPMPVSPPKPVEAPPPFVENKEETIQFKEPQETIKPVEAPVRPALDESNLSQCSSQDSVCSVKDAPMYEKDESHLRPSSQNSNYSFNDVIASQSVLYQKGIETIMECQDKYAESYEHEGGNYEMYEHLAMAYQSDVASQASSSQEGQEAGCGGGGGGGAAQRIETLVRARARGEIKCDWRPGAPPARAPRAPARPSRWGLKPGEVNIVLTGGEQDLTADSPELVYQIQSIANRSDAIHATGYDEAYMDTYGALDRLQYGDCFSTDAMGIDESSITQVELLPMPTASPPMEVSPEPEDRKERTSTLDARIDQALRETVLGEVAKEEAEPEDQRDGPEKGILITNVNANESGRGLKRVSFADGYKPGQDSDVEEPPIKKRVRVRVRAGRAARAGCAWPCPAAHPDHVPLWDALPPPPPPPGDPPACCRRALLAPARILDPAGNTMSNPLAGFMPPEPPPGLISF